MSALDEGSRSTRRVTICDAKDEAALLSAQPYLNISRWQTALQADLRNIWNSTCVSQSVPTMTTESSNSSLDDAHS